MNGFLTYGLVGENVSRSFSPRLYNIIFDELGMTAVYVPFPVERSRFFSALAVLRDNFSGFNVKAPFRDEIVAHLDMSDATVKSVGTANTVVVKDGKLVGYNTEIEGFERSLIGFAGSLYDKDVLLVGSGGVARAVASVLLDKGAFLTVVSRNEDHAARLERALQDRCHKGRLRFVKGLAASDTFDAVFNTARVDLESDLSDIYIHPRIYKNLRIAYDTTYVSTTFLKKAQGYGVKTKNGFDMLFFQAIVSAKIWAGREIDAHTIRRIYSRVRQEMDGD